MIEELVVPCVSSRRLPCRSRLPSLRGGQILFSLCQFLLPHTSSFLWKQQSARRTVIFEIFNLNSNSLLFQMIRDSDFTHWADLCMSSDPTYQNRIFIVSRVCSRHAPAPPPRPSSRSWIVTKQCPQSNSSFCAAGFPVLENA